MNVQRSLNLNAMTEVPLSKAPNPQLLPGYRSINGCPLLWVCVHGVCVRVFTLDGLYAEHEFRVWVTILDRMSRHFHLLLFFLSVGLSVHLLFNSVKMNYIYLSFSCSIYSSIYRSVCLSVVLAIVLSII